jgi:hypothetical protein
VLHEEVLVAVSGYGPRRRTFSTARTIRTFATVKVKESPLLSTEISRADREAISTRTQAASELRWWADRDWTGGLELRRLSGLDRFTVRTRNSVYEFTVLTADTGDVLVRGGHFFPEHTRARIAGCSLGGSCLKVGSIYPGFLMELHRADDGQRIVTTRVQAIASLPPGPLQ